MRSTTTTNGMTVGYAEAKSDVADAKMLASILRQLEEITSQIEILLKAVEMLAERAKDEPQMKHE